MNVNIRYIKDENKNIISPVTSMDSVFDSNNKSLTTRLDEIGSLESVPVGTIMEYTSSTLPNNYLLCNGAAISRDTYTQLFNVIGTTYGEGDGSTTFNLPVRAGYVTTSSTNDGTTVTKYFIIKYKNASVMPDTAQVINNTSTSTTDVYSANKVNSEIDSAKSQIYADINAEVETLNNKIKVNVEYAKPSPTNFYISDRRVWVYQQSSLITGKQLTFSTNLPLSTITPILTYAYVRNSQSNIIYPLNWSMFREPNDVAANGTDGITYTLKNNGDVQLISRTEWDLIVHFIMFYTYNGGEPSV